MESTEDKKAISRRWLEEGWSTGNLDVADQLIAPDCAVHGAGGQRVESGPEGVKQLVQAWRTAFPD